MREGMVDREDDQGTESRRHLEEVDAVAAIGPVVEVGEHDALGVARRTRGIADGDGVVFLGFGRDGIEAGGKVRTACLDRLPGFQAGFVESYNSLGGDAVPGCGLAGEGAVLVEIEEDNSLVLQRREGADDLFQLVPAREDGFRLGVVQAKRYFLREQLDGKGYRYAARVEHADFPQDPFRPALRHYRQAIPLLEAPRDEPRGEGAGTLARLGEGNRVPTRVSLLQDIGMRAPLFGRFIHHAEDRALHHLRITWGGMPVKRSFLRSRPARGPGIDIGGPKG